MERFLRSIIILGIVLVYIHFNSFEYSGRELMSNLDQSSGKKLVVISDGIFSQIVKYFAQDKFQPVSLSEWKKKPKPFDIFLVQSSINIGNIEKSLKIIENMCEKVNQSGKIINFDDKLSGLSKHILLKFIEELGEKYYKESVGVCSINLDTPIDTNTIEFVLGEPWNVLTTRAFSNKLIGNKSPGYLLGISQEYSRANLLSEQVGKNKFNGETVIVPEIEPKELTVYSNNSGTLGKKLGEYHGVEPNQIEFHNGIMGFLQQMISVFVPEAYEIISWQMSYLTRLARTANVIESESIIKNFNAVPNYKQILSKISSKTRLIYLSGPIEKEPFDVFIQLVPKNIIVIIDFCYNGFVEDKLNQNLQMKDCIKYNSYVLGINTFSKANGLAGVHLSYSIGHEHIQTIIANYFHYPLNLFYEKLAIKSIEPTYTKLVKDFYTREKTRLTNQLKGKNIPHWFELAVTLVIDLTNLPKDKILSNINNLGLENYWKISGNYLKIYLSTEQINFKLVSAIIN